MKNLFKGAILTAAATFAFTACSKNQKVANRLEGDWKVTGLKFYVNGTLDNAITLDSNATILITFDDCKLKSEEWCRGTSKIINGSQTINESFKYKITDDGESFVQDLNYDIRTAWDRIIATITESNKKSFKFNYSKRDGFDIHKYEYEWTAQ